MIAKWIARVWHSYGGLAVIVLLVGLVIAVSCLIGAGVVNTTEWSKNLDDPIERGLSYIAIAIVAHGLLSRGSSVDVNVKPPTT